MSNIDSNTSGQGSRDELVSSSNDDTVSRRELLRGGMAAAVASGVTLAGGSVLTSTVEGAPAILTGTQKGRKFRAFMAFGGNPPGVTIQNSTARVETVTMKALDPDRVVVRTEAAQVCYSIVGQVVAQVPVVLQRNAPPEILGHSAVGIVEAVGSRVKRVQVGDRVMLANTPQCGVCYNCLRDRPDRCINTGNAGPAVIGTLSDGTPVVQQHDRGGFAELVVATEDYCIPNFYNVPPLELAMLGCPAAVGLGCTLGFVAPVTVGSDVCVLGCGPLGLSAVQGARIKGASQIIAVEPIAARRELARQFGATTLIDPNVDTAHLVDKIREMCRGPNTRTYAGGKAARVGAGAGGSGAQVGPDFVVEAVGGDYFPPKAGAGPDPTGVLSLQWAWDLCSPAGHVSTVAVGENGHFTIPAAQWSNGSKNHHPGNFNGVATLRDMQIFARLVERGQFNSKAMVTATFPLERTKEALQLVADRETIAAMIVFS
jgi:S-(hydroxymethyl)glutathione dehydrogenase/alcohol dehydrogenase